VVPALQRVWSLRAMRRWSDSNATVMRSTSLGGKPIAWASWRPPELRLRSPGQSNEPAKGTTENPERRKRNVDAGLSAVQVDRGAEVTRRVRVRVDVVRG